MPDSHHGSKSKPPELLPDQPRRGFFASAAAIVIGGVVGLVPLVTGTLFFLDPLLRKKAKADAGKEGDQGFVKVDVTLEQLKAAKQPIQVPIISTRVDKWNLYPDQPIGSVYLQLGEDGQTLAAFNVTCPHLGCAVEFREIPVDKTREFYCPCHASAFTLDGKKKNEIPPRDLDSVEVKVVKNDQGVDEVWVKYQEFRATLSEKVPV
jgi:Rieske Fe-S protein